MRIKHDDLKLHLEKGFAGMYLIYGSEPLLVEETLDEFRGMARKQGLTDRTRYTVEPGFNWEILFEQSQTMSIFREKKLIELRMPTGKPGDKGSTSLIEYAKNPVEEVTLVVVAGHIDRTGQNTRWFKTIADSATLIQCPNIASEQLPRWIRQRLRSRNLEAEDEAIRLLCQMVEGNLLAAAQEIDLLRLLYQDQMVTLEIVEDLIANHARHDTFMLVDACLLGHQDRAMRMLYNMKRTGSLPILILWVMVREVRQICQIYDESERQKASPQSLYQRFGIWSARQKVVASAMNRLGRLQWERVLVQLCFADHRMKGGIPMVRKDEWEELENIVLGMCGVPTLEHVEIIESN